MYKQLTIEIGKIDKLRRDAFSLSYSSKINAERYVREIFEDKRKDEQVFYQGFPITIDELLKKL